MKRIKNAPYPYYDMPDVWTLRELTDYGKEKGENVTAFYRGRHNDVPLSFGGCSRIIRQLGTYLLSQGFEADHIAIIGENSTEWVMSFLAICCSGNVAVPLDRGLPHEDIAELARHCECRAVIYSDKCRAAAEYLQSLGDTFVTVRFMPLGDLDEWCAEGERLLSEGDASFDEAGSRIDKDTLATIVYTSGTSGKMKGVMLSHGNLCSDVSAACKVAEGDNAQLLLPLHHTFAWATQMLAAFIYIKDLHISGDLRHILKDFQRNRPQNVAAVPMMADMLYKGIWNTAAKQGSEKKLRSAIRLSRALMRLGIDRRRSLFKDVHENFGGRLEMIMCGGAHLDTETEKGLYDLGIHVVNGYGITECSPIVSANRNHDFRFGSVGRPLPCNRVRIDGSDENGVGEILVSGPNVMMGYYREPEATAEAFDGEWFRTGDYGRFDSDGFLYITGRKKNLIILSNGENVSPEELELKLSRIEYVADVAVYEEYGRITAEFYLDEGAFPDARERLDGDVKAFNGKMPKSKNIAKIKVRDVPFEKTTTMKIKRYLLSKTDKGQSGKTDNE